MTSISISRYFVLALILSITVVGIMLSVFYWQYRTSTENLVGTSADLYVTAQTSGFETRATDRLNRIADSVAVHSEPFDTGFVTSLLELTMTNESDLLGISYSGLDGINASAGGAVAPGLRQAEAPDTLTVEVPVEKSGKSIGSLYGYFSLASVYVDAAAYRQEIADRKSTRLNSSH